MSINNAAKTVTTADLEIYMRAYDDDETEMPISFANRGSATDFMTTAYADAYLKVLYDGGGDSDYQRASNPFQKNTDFHEIEATINTALESKANRSALYWASSILIGYQPGELYDYDPNIEEESGIYVGMVPEGFNIGAMVFWETLNEANAGITNPEDINIQLGQTMAHETAHLFHLNHDNGKIMGTLSTTDTDFHLKDLSKIRDWKESPASVAK